jgi:photosystem II stability/assembly factor-like uncharacterized protein
MMSMRMGRGLRPLTLVYSALTVTGLHGTKVAASWTEQNANSPEMLLFVDAVTTEIAWAGGSEASGLVVVTTDGGAHWEQVAVPGAGRIQGLVAFDENRCVVADGNDFWRTTNGGLAWDHAHSLSGTSINGIYFFDDQNGWAIADPVSGDLHFVILETTDGGITWNSSPGAPSGSPGMRGFWRSFDWIGSETGVFGTTGGSSGGLRTVVPNGIPYGLT